MSIQSEIDRIRGNVNASLRAVAEKGVDVQESDGSNELPSLIASIPTPDVSGQIAAHNTNTEAHNDIRELITGLTNRLNALADSNDTTLDQLSEIVAYIKSNRSLIESITTSKVNVADIIDNLTTNVSNKPLSAAQGVVLKALIDAITVPTKVSELENDSGYLTSYTETDPTVPAWAKAADKPTYTAAEVGARPSTWTPTAADVGARPSTWTPTKIDIGLDNVDNVKQYSASNPPPYPVTSVNGQSGAVTVSVPTVPSTTNILKGNGSGGVVAATRGSDYIASGNITKQTLVASESTPTENYDINWVYG